MARDPQTRKTTKGQAQRNANTSPIASGSTTFKLGGVWWPWSEEKNEELGGEEREAVEQTYLEIKRLAFEPKLCHPLGV